MLIRTKIQQRCATTRDLIQQIRKTKLGNESKITPSEFRFILIKFGIILTQTIVDRIFNIFDADRSGTMDYDEFCCWIMNEDSIPRRAVSEAEADRDAAVRGKVLACMSHNPAHFASVNPQLGYTAFIAFFNLLPNSSLSEIEARSLFVSLTRKNVVDVIDMTQLRSWAQGQEYNPIAQAAVAPSSLAQDITKEFGSNRGIIKQCFLPYAGQGKTLIGFEEFRKCLLSQGHGLDVVQTKNLFLSFGGAGGYVDTAFILSIVENSAVVVKSFVESKPHPCNRVNELIREAMRKCYRELYKEFRAADTTNSGYVTTEQMHSIVSASCIPLTHADFRGVLKQIRANEASDVVNWHSFLMQYSPLKPQLFLPPAQRTVERPQTTGGASSIASIGMGPSSSLAALGSRVAHTVSPQPLPQSDGSAPEDSADVVPSVPADVSSEEAELAERVSARTSPRMRGVWQAALNLCKLADPDKQGLVSRDAFLCALEKSDSRDRLSEGDRTALANSFAAGTRCVDYRRCFRTYLNELAAFTVVPASPFSGFSHSASRETKPRHPWEFDYKRENSTFNPYIPTSKGKLTVLDYVRARSFPRLLEAKQEAEEVTALLSKYEAKVLGICKKCANSMSAVEVKYLEQEFRCCESRATRTGIVSPLLFQSTLAQYFKGLSASETGSLLRAFRISETERDVSYQAFMHVCTVMRYAANF